MKPLTLKQFKRLSENDKYRIGREIISKQYADLDPPEKPELLKTDYEYQLVISLLSDNNISSLLNYLDTLDSLNVVCSFIYLHDVLNRGTLEIRKKQNSSDDQLTHAIHNFIPVLCKALSEFKDAAGPHSEMICNGRSHKYGFIFA